MQYRDNPYSVNALYEEYLKAIRSSKWKASSQKYSHNFLSEITALSEEILNGRYHSDPTSEFLINERGKTRLVCGNTVRDRTARHALCDNVLMPAVRKKVRYDNAASQIGKGTDFCRKRLKQHLHEYYRKYGNNGYILIGDVSKYYDNVRHDIAEKQLDDLIPDDEISKKLLHEVFAQMAVDVTCLPDEERQNCMERKFDSVEFYAKYGLHRERGKYFMHKSLKTGDQISQLVGIYYLHDIDNLIQCVYGIRYFGRFNDDFYAISNSKDQLHDLLKDIREELANLGLELNEKKTVICRIDRPFKFMKNNYWITNTGRVPEKLNPNNIRRERTKLKKLKAHNVSYEEASQQYKSWIGAYHKKMSKQQIRNMNELFASLYGKDEKEK